MIIMQASAKGSALDAAAAYVNEEAGFDTVSYTHLDVYKRQLQQGSRRRAFRRVRHHVLHQLHRAVFRREQEPARRDVYKRQVQDADRIIVMEGGRIKDIGNHDELLKTSEIYREKMCIRDRHRTSRAADSSLP